MGAIKENVYTHDETNLFYVARAFAHPMRIRIITELLVDRPYRNIDFVKMLGMAKPTIKAHIDMLKDAELVRVEYYLHFYEISLNRKGRKWSELFLEGNNDV